MAAAQEKEAKLHKEREAKEKLAAKIKVWYIKIVEYDLGFVCIDRERFYDSWFYCLGHKK